MFSDCKNWRCCGSIWPGKGDGGGAEGGKNQGRGGGRAHQIQEGTKEGKRKRAHTHIE